MSVIASASVATGVTSAIDTTGATMLVLVQAWTTSGGDPIDSYANTWTRILRQNSPSNAQLDVFVAFNPIVGSGHTFTSGGSFETLCVVALDELHSISFAYSRAGSGGSSVTSIQPGALTPPIDECVLLAFLAYRTEAVTPAIDSSFSILQHQNFVSGVQVGSALAIKTQTTAAAENPTWSWTGASGANAAMIVLLPFENTDTTSGIDSTFPAITGALTGGHPNVDSLILSSFPKVTGELYGGPPIDADIISGPGAVAGALLGGQPVNSDIAGTLPKPTGLLLGGVTVLSYISGSFPAMQGIISSAELEALIEGAFPKMSAALIGHAEGSYDSSIIGTFPRISGALRADAPVYKLTMTINGEDVGDFWQQFGWNVDKHGSQERMNFLTADPVESAGAFRVEENDIVLLKHPYGGLIFGGFVQKVKDGRIKSEKGVLNEVTAVDWMFLLDKIFLPRQKFPNHTDWFTLFGIFYEQYLRARGMINITPPSGGAILPELVIDTPVTSLRAFCDRVKELTSQPVRVNGELWIAVIEEGGLVWPGGEVNGSNAKLIPEVTWTKESITSANRLWLQTTTPPAGPGPYWYTETHLADGIKTVFPTNVIPSKVSGSLAADVNATATSISLKELPIGGRIRWGNRFYINGDPREYMVTADATVDTAGTVTISCETIELDATDGTQVTFDPPAFMILAVNNTDTPFAGAPWVWENVECAMVNPAIAPPLGTSITVGMWITHPVHVRAWETSTPVPVVPVGWFDFSILNDGLIEDEEIWDPAYAVQILREKLLDRPEGLQIVQFTTFEHGIYPYISFPMNFPDRLIFGTYHAEKVEIHPNGAEVDHPNGLEYIVTARKSILGKSPWDYYRGGSRIKWGSSPDALPTDFQWTANQEFSEPSGTTGIVLNPPNGWVWTDWEDVIPITDADLVIVGILVEEADTHQPYYGWGRRFHVELGVGDPGSETPIARFHGTSDCSGYSAGLAKMRLAVPVDACPQGSRLAIRIKASTSTYFLPSTGPWNLSVQYYKKPLTGNLQTTPYLNAISVDTEPTAVAGSTGSDVWSDWVPLELDMPYDAYITGFMFDVESFTYFDFGRVQFAVSAVGEEPVLGGVIGTFGINVKLQQVNMTNFHPLPNPMYVNGNTRVSVRIKSTSVNTDAYVALQYVRAEE